MLKSSPFIRPPVISLEPLPAHLGRRRDAQPVGLVLEDQGVDQVALLQAAEGLAGHELGSRLDDEHVGPAPLPGQLVELALVDRWP